MSEMDRAARILLVEDSSVDAGLIARGLRQAGLDVELRVAASEEMVRASLQAFEPDVILADLSIPGFSGAAAVALAHDWDPSVPCILVSGTLGEELVTQALRIGATDYVPKQHLDALAPAVRRALAEGAERRARARLEAELAESNALLTALMENVPDHVYFKDVDSRFTMISRSMARSFGLDDPAQAIGKTDFDFFTEDQARAAAEDEREIMRTGRPLVDHAESETWPDGRETWASSTKLPYKDGRGNTLGSFGISRDITGRMATESALRESEALYRSVVDGRWSSNRGGRSTRTARRFPARRTRRWSRLPRANPPRA
jgi:PAS domain S-box-containing protein